MRAFILICLLVTFGEGWLAPPRAIKTSRSSCLHSSTSADDASSSPSPGLSDVGFVLLAGGTGSRMKANMPKQFLELRGDTVLSHSLTLFLKTLPSMACGSPAKVVLVMDERYRSDFASWAESGGLVFADPGVERQGSVENGLAALASCAPEAKFVAVHDSARPLVTPAEVLAVVGDAKEHGAAVLGVPCKATIKESEDGEAVLRTIPRSR